MGLRWSGPIWWGPAPRRSVEGRPLEGRREGTDRRRDAAGGRDGDGCGAPLAGLPAATLGLARLEAREGPLALPMEAACPPAAASFVPIVTEASPAVADAASGEPNAERIGKPLSAPVIEIRNRSFAALLPLERTDVLGRPWSGVFELSLWMTLRTTRRVSSGGSSC